MPQPQGSRGPTVYVALHQCAALSRIGRLDTTGTEEESMTARTANNQIAPGIRRGGAKASPASAGRAPGSAPAAAGDPGDSYTATAMSDVLDHAARAMIARGTGGLSPAALGAMWADWAMHLAVSPGKQMRLVEKAMRKNLHFARYLGRCAASGGSAPGCIEPLAQDRRFRDEAWQQPPFNLMYQGFLLTQQWWHNASHGGARGDARA
ncbi:MAG TPA: poly-beta-hydroxybutyrate polymerase N-terminal domain-containing protein [Thermohalobaculum sp.]|nr:poly-beta-hydroxybutyrate polymerase N-terminal domain-containing protein [Thermohalobaculum sp.]